MKRIVRISVTEAEATDSSSEDQEVKMVAGASAIARGAWSGFGFV